MKLERSASKKNETTRFYEQGGVCQRECTSLKVYVDLKQYLRKTYPDPDANDGSRTSAHSQRPLCSQLLLHTCALHLTLPALCSQLQLHTCALHLTRPTRHPHLLLSLKLLL